MTTTVDQQLAATVARDAIRQCIATLARGEDRRDATLIARCCWPDMTVDFGLFAGTFAQYRDWVVPGAAPVILTLHTLGQSYIELDGDSARVETHVTSYHRIDTGNGQRDVMLGGRYLDTLARREHQWRIAQRTMLYDWCQDVGESADWAQGVLGAPLSGEHFIGRTRGDFSEQFFAGA